MTSAGCFPLWPATQMLQQNHGAKVTAESEAMAVFKETFNAPDRTMNLASDGVWWNTQMG